MVEASRLDGESKIKRETRWNQVHGKRLVSQASHCFLRDTLKYLSQIAYNSRVIKRVWTTDCLKVFYMETCGGNCVVVGFLLSEYKTRQIHSYNTYTSFDEPADIPETAVRAHFADIN